MFRTLYVSLASSMVVGAVLVPAAQAEVMASKHVPGYCMDIKNGSQAVLWNCHGGSNQNFQFSGYGPVMYGGKCLDTASSTPSREGDALVMKDCSSKPSQKWGVSGARFNNEEGYCADIKGGSRERGTPIIAWKCGGQTNQQWSLGRVVPLSQGAKLGLPSASVQKLVDADARINSGGGIISGGAGNIISGGAGNIISGGAGNLVILK